MNKKDYREYQEKYGDIPKSYFDRFLFIIDSLKLKVKDIEILRNAIKKLTKVSWTTTNFVFYMVPKATPRARRSGRTGVFYVKNASDNSKLFKEFIDTNPDLRVITTATKLIVDIYLPLPSGMTSKKDMILAELQLIRPYFKPDWDNAGKTYSDMIQKYFLLDDSLVVDGRVRKFYSFKPRIEIRVDAMDKYDCKFNKRKVESWKSYQEVIDRIEEKEAIE